MPEIKLSILVKLYVSGISLINYFEKANPRSLTPEYEGQNKESNYVMVYENENFFIMHIKSMKQ